MPQTFPAVDPESIALLFKNGLFYNEAIFNQPLSINFDLFVAGKFFEIPNQYLRGHSFGKDLFIVFFHDGSGDAVDQQYLAAHEMTHFYMWNTFGQPNSFLLSEGTAVWVGKSITSNSSYIQLEPFCKAYQLAGQLPLISDVNLLYKGQNYDLENYYAAGCFVKYLVETYGEEKLGEIYTNADYERFYDKSLIDLENEWRDHLFNLATPLGFSYQDLISLNNQLKSAYHSFFASEFTSPEMLAPYMALDQARLAFLSLHFDEAKALIADYYELVQ